jgi:hypothetical protein
MSFLFQIVLTPKPVYQTESTALAHSPRKFLRTAVTLHMAKREESKPKQIKISVSANGK